MITQLIFFPSIGATNRYGKYYNQYSFGKVIPWTSFLYNTIPRILIKRVSLILTSISMGSDKIYTCIP